MTATQLGAGKHKLYARPVVGIGSPSEASSPVVQIITAKPGGTFVKSNSQPAAAANMITDFIVGDFNGDGYPDVATCSWSGVNVYLNKGDGSLAAPTPYLSTTHCVSITVADMNLDGYPDLIAATSSGVFLLAGKANGTFQNGAAVSNVADINLLRAADVNSDGIPDLIASRVEADTIETLLGNGDGTFSAGAVTTFPNTVRTIDIGDFNGDGVPDVAALSVAGNNVQIVLGNGDGSFHFGASYVFYSGASILSADLNQDGIPDLAIGGVGLIRVLAGNGDGTFHPIGDVNSSELIQWGDVNAIKTADVNGDGKLDLLALPYGGRGFLVLLGKGDGTWQPPFGHIKPAGQPACGGRFQQGRRD